MADEKSDAPQPGFSENHDDMKTIRTLIYLLSKLVAPYGPEASVACLLSVARSIRTVVVEAGACQDYADTMPLELLTRAAEVERHHGAALDATEPTLRAGGAQ